MTLPPLPEPDGWIYDGMPGGLLEFKRGQPTYSDSLCRSSAPMFTADALRAYAAAAVAAERERCALVCEDKERRKWELLTRGGRMEGFGPMDCAAAIRAQAPSQAPTP